GYPRVEATGYQPLPRDQALARVLHILGLDQPAYLLSLGQERNRLYKFREAVPVLRRVTQLQPSFSAWDSLSWALNEIGEHQEALHAAEEALKLRSRSADALKLKAWALNGSGNYAE